MVRNNHVVPPEEAQKILDEYNVELGSTYSKYKAKPAGVRHFSFTILHQHLEYKQLLCTDYEEKNFHSHTICFY